MQMQHTHTTQTHIRTHTQHTHAYTHLHTLSQLLLSVYFFSPIISSLPSSPISFALYFRPLLMLSFPIFLFFHFISFYSFTYFIFANSSSSPSPLFLLYLLFSFIVISFPFLQFLQYVLFLLSVHSFSFPSLFLFPSIHPTSKFSYLPLLSLSLPIFPPFFILICLSFFPFSSYSCSVSFPRLFFLFPPPSVLHYLLFRFF